MKLLTGKTLPETLYDFNEESWRVNALDYNQFLNYRCYNNNKNSFIDALYYLQKVVKYSTYKEVNKRLSNKTNIDLVLEFYEKLGLREQVEPIVLGKHPLFKTFLNKKSTSQVAHRGVESKLIFMVGETGTFNGIINLVHESTHAINGHYSHMQELLKQQNEIVEKYGYDSKEFKKYKQVFDNYQNEQSSYKHDCITETETKIIEFLFLDFLIEKNTISPEDKQLYINQRNNSFRNDLKLMFQEDILYSEIINIKKENGCHEADLTEEEFNEMCERLQKNSHYKKIIDKFYFIANRKNLKKLNWHSLYRFRYVVGEIISTVWYKKYTLASKNEKQQMLEDLKYFIANNNKIELEDAIKILLKDLTCEDLVNQFTKIHKSKSEEIIV